MKKKKVLLSGLLLALGITGVATNSKAVKIKGYNGTDEFYLSKCGGVCTYSAAYEYYGNEEVLAGGDNLDTIAIFELGTDYSTNDTAAITLDGAKFLDPEGINENATQYCLYDGSGIVAVQNGELSFPTDQLFIKFTSDVSNGTKLTLGVCNGTIGQADGSYLDNMTKVQLNPNLGASCEKNAVVKIKWNYPNDCCEAEFITIKPKSIVGGQPLDLTAELDADNDFKTFIGGHTIRDACCTPGTAVCNCGMGGKCFGKTTEQPTTCPDAWVLGASFNPAAMNIAKISFDLVSLYPEPGVKEIKFEDGTKCTTSDNKVWHCESDCIPCPLCSEGSGLTLEITGDTELNPTLWSVENPSVTGICPTDPHVKDICCNLTPGPAGTWYGGVEAIIPFVRNSNGYYTTIKLFNRYDKDAKVFAEVFSKTSNNPMLLAVTQIGTIPAGKGLVITGADLASIFPDADWEFGQAVKLLIRVPSGTGCINETDGTECYNNSNDPFVEGYVVYDTPQGTRTVPLKFKSFKNGQYAE